MTTINIQSVKALLLLQWQELKRDRGTLFLNFVFPLLFVAGLYLQTQMNPSFQFKFAMVDGGPASTHFVQLLTNSPNVGVQPMTAEAAEAALKDGSIHAVLQMPAGDVLEHGQTLQVRTTPNFEELTHILLDAASARAIAPEQRLAYRVAVASHGTHSQIAYVYPGILAMALVQLGLFATAVPLLQARERGTLRFLLLTPARPLELLLSQVGLRVAVALVQIVFLLMAGQQLLGLTDVPWLAVAGAASLGVLLLVSLGYAIAGMAPSLQVGMSMVMIANFTLMFGGNIFWDPNTSKALLVVAHVVPLSYLSDLFRQLITGSKGLWSIGVDVAAIVAWSLAAIAIATRTLRFDTQDRGSRAVPQGA